MSGLFIIIIRILILILVLIFHGKHPLPESVPYRDALSSIHSAKTTE